MGSSLYRKLYFEFWNDEYIQGDLEDSAEILLYIALITNPKTTACGIYKVIPSYLSSITKVPREKVDATLKKLIDDGRILYNYSTKEIFVLNTMKYSTRLNNPKFNAQLRNELILVKHQPFVEMWFEKLKEFGLQVDTLTGKNGEEHRGFTKDDILCGQRVQPLSETEEGKREQPTIPGTPEPTRKKKQKRKEGADDEEKATDPNIRIVIDHYYEVFQEVRGCKPKLGKADAPTVQKNLKNMSVDEIKNLIEFVVDVYFRDKPEGKGMAGTLKSCFSPFFVQEYNVEWQKRKFDYSDRPKPVTGSRWWRP